MRAAAVMTAPSRVSHSASYYNLAWMHRVAGGSTGEKQHRCVPSRERSMPHALSAATELLYMGAGAL